MGQVISRKIRPIGGRIRNHSDQSEHVLRSLKLYFCLFQKNELIFSYFSFDSETNYYQINFVNINNHFCESLQLNHLFISEAITLGFDPPYLFCKKKIPVFQGFI